MAFNAPVGRLLRATADVSTRDRSHAEAGPRRGSRPGAATCQLPHASLAAARSRCAAIQARRSSRR
jgi:hypothetical protein